MIIIKSAAEIECMKHAGEISAGALALAGSLVAPGISTKEIDKQVYDFIKKAGAKPSFLGLYDFPGSACFSVNDVIIHGKPSDIPLKNGDLVSIDVGAFIEGFHGDNAATFACGECIDEDLKFMKTTYESLEKGVAAAIVGARIGDISAAVEAHVRASGYGLINHGYAGHGVGRKLHEDPTVPNTGKAGFGPRLREGMTFAIEPMTMLVGDGFKHLDDEWTVVSKSKTKAAHFEFTIAIKKEGPLILTPRLYDI